MKTANLEILQRPMPWVLVYHDHRGHIERSGYRFENESDAQKFANAVGYEVRHETELARHGGAS